MKRRVLAFLCAVAFMALAASPAWAVGGNGHPGATFPEIPPGKDGKLPYQQSCVALAENPGVGPSSGRSQIAQAISTGLYNDSCIEGFAP